MDKGTPVLLLHWPALERDLRVWTRAVVGLQREEGRISGEFVCRGGGVARQNHVAPGSLPSILGWSTPTVSLLPQDMVEQRAAAPNQITLARFPILTAAPLPCPHEVPQSWNPVLALFLPCAHICNSTTCPGLPKPNPLPSSRGSWGLLPGSLSSPCPSTNNSIFYVFLGHSHMPAILLGRPVAAPSGYLSLPTTEWPQSWCTSPFWFPFLICTHARCLFEWFQGVLQVKHYLMLMMINDSSEHQSTCRTLIPGPWPCWV